MKSRTRVVFLIRSLARGGAERQLALLASGLDPGEFDVRILTFYPGGAVWEELQRANHVRLESLNKRGRWDLVRFVWRLARYLRAWPPHILHCYLVEPSILGLIAARLAGKAVRVVWGIRASNMDHSKYEWLTRITFMAAAVLSRFADAIVANSYAGRSYHQRRGYKSRHFAVIPNGIDTERFRPSVHARRATRQALGIGDTDLLIGVAARLDPMKGHDVLLRALPAVIMGAPHARIGLIGDGAPSYARQLQSLAHDLGIASSVIWAGEASDMSAVYPAFDVACSPSVFGEGFSNSVGEAMACGVPCVVTDVGDSARVVGDTGRVVTANDHAALAEALSEMAMRSPEQRTAEGMRARDRVKTHFALRTMIDQTSSLYRQLIAVTRSAGGEQG